MEHKYVAVEANQIQTPIYCKSNNLDEKDNLDTLPDTPAIYGICGRVNGSPVNMRFVGYSQDLRSAVREHFTENISANSFNKCVKQFLLSIKSKELVYMHAGGISEDERNRIVNDWKVRYQVNCNEELNKVY